VPILLLHQGSVIFYFSFRISELDERLRRVEGKGSKMSKKKTAKYLNMSKMLFEKKKKSEKEAREAHQEQLRRSASTRVTGMLDTPDDEEAQFVGGAADSPGARRRVSALFANNTGSSGSSKNLLRSSGKSGRWDVGASSGKIENKNNNNYYDEDDRDDRNDRDGNAFGRSSRNLNSNGISYPEDSYLPDLESGPSGSSPKPQLSPDLERRRSQLLNNLRFGSSSSTKSTKSPSSSRNRVVSSGDIGFSANSEHNNVLPSTSGKDSPVTPKTL
jgi:hypothetical protein